MVTLVNDRATTEFRSTYDDEHPHPMPRLAAAVRVSLVAYIVAIVAVVVLRGIGTVLSG